MEETVFEQRISLDKLQEAVAGIRGEISKVIVGQEELIKFIIAALLADGHVLLEGVPGVAKTMMAKLTAKCLDIQFSRIQFTPDLMPSDVLGTSVFNPKDVSFEFRRGPVFSNIVLIDEVNRSPAKTQAALFEVMEEKQVSIDGQTHFMDAPFIVIATQNPIEQEGTYRLPEAQLDRFLFKLIVPYPKPEDEVNILMRFHQMGNAKPLDTVKPVLNAANVNFLRSTVKSIVIEEKLLRFIADIVVATRQHKSIYLGASPRASLALLNSSKALAAIAGRDFVIPDDILDAVAPVLRHRIMLTAEKEMEGITPDEVIRQIIQSVEVPR